MLYYQIFYPYALQYAHILYTALHQNIKITN